MRMFSRMLGAGLLCLVIAACQTVTLIKAGESVEVAKTYRVQPQIA